MDFSERLARAAKLAENPEAYIYCKLRGEIVGERMCQSCGGEKMRPVRTCPYHPEGVVIIKECRRCERVEFDDTKRIKIVMAEIQEPDVVASRRAICLNCPMHFNDKGHIRCRLCVCDDPPSMRKRCPAFKWGDDGYLPEVLDTETTMTAQQFLNNLPDGAETPKSILASRLLEEREAGLDDETCLKIAAEIGFEGEFDALVSERVTDLEA